MCDVKGPTEDPKLKPPQLTPYEHCLPRADRPTGHCARQLSITDKSTYRRKGLVWLMVSDVLVHGQLTHYLWICGGTVHLGRNTRLRRPTYLVVAQKQREKQEGLRLPYPLKTTPPMT